MRTTVLTKYRNLLALAFMLLAPLVTSAATFDFPIYNSYNDSQQLENLEGQRHYAELTGFPHNYYFSVASSTDLQVSVSIPNLPEASQRLGAIIVKQLARNGGVEEITRLQPSAAAWESFDEPVGNDTYRQGPSFSGTLAPGDYLLEVNTPDNISKYVLTIGQPSFSVLNLVGEYKRVYLVKKFYGKSVLAVLESPLYYVPVSLLFLWLTWRYRRKCLGMINRLRTQKDIQNDI